MQSAKCQIRAGLRLQGSMDEKTRLMSGADGPSGLDCQFRLIAFATHMQLDEVLKSFGAGVSQDGV
jgi:hypothetical protein